MRGAFALLAGVFSTGLGLSFLAAGLTQAAPLAWFRAHPVPPYAALQFVFGGIGILSIALGFRWVALIAGMVVSAAASLTLVAYVKGIELGISVPILGKVVALEAYSPARVTLHIAVSFLLAGLASILMSKRIPFAARSLLVALLGGVVLATGLDMVFGFFAGFKSVYGWGAYARIDLPTGIGFTAVGAGLFAIAWREGVRPGELAPRWLPSVVALGVAAITLFEWQGVIFRERTAIQHLTRVQAVLIGNEIRSRLEPRIRAVEAMAKQYGAKKRISRREWIADASLVLRQESGFQAIEWVDPTFHVRWVVPHSGNEADRGLDLTRNDPRRTAVVKAFLRRETIASRPMKLAQGGAGLAVAAPVFRKDQLRGIILAVFPVKTILDEDTKNVAPGYSFIIQDQDQPIYQRIGSGDQRHFDLAAEAAVQFRGATWRVAVWPGAPPSTAPEFSLDRLILSAGLLLAVLLALTVYLLQTARARAREVEAMNRALQEKIAAAERAERAARILNEELQAFTYSVSHDLRTPVRHMDGFANYLEEELGRNAGESAKYYLMRIREGARQMGQLIDDLLNLSRVGRQALNLRRTDLNEVVKEALAGLDDETQGRKIEFQLGHLPTLSCDPGLMKILFSNLLSNALKFTRPRMQAVIEVGVSGAGEEPVLFVRDNGVGFDMQYAGQLFGVFQRMHSPDEFEGTGIGLATVRRIIEKHGGRVWAESEIDVGTTFHIAFPDEGTSEEGQSKA